MMACVGIVESGEFVVRDGRPECTVSVSIKSPSFTTLGSSGVGSGDVATGGRRFDVSGKQFSQAAAGLRSTRRTVKTRAILWLVSKAAAAARAAKAVSRGAEQEITKSKSECELDGVQPAKYSPSLAETPRLVEPTSEMAATDILGCGSTVSPSTLQAVIKVESRGRPFAIHVNGLALQPPTPRTGQEATSQAEAWIASGFSVDLGLMQVNSRNLSALGYTVAQMFDACTNVRVGAAILTADYISAAVSRGDPQQALRAALSAYNTGSFEQGFYNGYVARYYNAPDTTRYHLEELGVRRLTSKSIEVQPKNPYTAAPTIYHRSTE